jgi:solute carrier family 12 (potassium/chloride transporters), member 9
MSATGNSLLKATRRHANFQSRTATDELGELNRRSTVIEEDEPSDIGTSGPGQTDDTRNPYEPATNASIPQPKKHSLTKRLLHIPDNDDSRARGRSASRRRNGQNTATPQDLLAGQIHNGAESKKVSGEASVPKAGLGPRPIGGNEKLGMFSGVYVPTCLNVLSILMFLRFGFILG